MSELNFKVPIHKIVKHTQKTGRQQPMNCRSVFDHFVGLVLKGLTKLLAADAYSRSFQTSMAELF